MKKSCHGAALATWAIVCGSVAFFAQPTPTKQTDASIPVKVYKAGKDVTAPEFRAMDFSNAITDECDGVTSGAAELSFIVDAAGQPRNIMFIHPIGNDLDKLALVIVGADRFKPGDQNGVPVAVSRSVKIHLDTWNANIKEESGQTVKRLRLHAQPIQRLNAARESPAEAVFAPISNSKDPVTFKVGGKIRPPVPIIWPQAEYTAEAKKKGINGVCMFSIVVDAQGMVQSPRLIRALEPSLDQKALEAIERYRFKPAVFNSQQPVPVTITIEVNFRPG